jgi:hypothetical protein
MRLIRLRTPREWRWARCSLVAPAMAGLVLVLAGELRGGVALFGLAQIGLILLESAQLRSLIVESDLQHQALLQIRPLMGELPVDLGGWAADPLLLHTAVQLLVNSRPHLVLECGSGSSTVILARCLRALGRGRIVSLDHDAGYARRTADLLRLHGLDDVATVVTAPLADRELNGRTFRWYGAEYEPFLQERIDVLLVDGPPGSSAPRARYPAVPILRRVLAPECWIVMHDGDRPDERAIAQAWRAELGGTLSYLRGGRGGWLLHRQDPGARKAP